MAAGLFIASYLLYAEVMRENTYLSRTVEVQDNQEVIDTGLYGIVRHPMYMAFLIMLGYIPVIAKRIANEEEVLEKGLEGYQNYKKKVRYKMIPFLW